MQINNIEKFNAVIEAAKTRAAGNTRWIKAIERAADNLLNNPCITEVADGLIITSGSGETYRVSGQCQCKAHSFGDPCWHRAAAKLVQRYNETEKETVSFSVSPANERANLIVEIRAIWPIVEPGLPLENELLARFGKSNLEFLDTDMLRRVRLAIAI
jgi:hypothetical protein